MNGAMRTTFDCDQQQRQVSQAAALRLVIARPGHHFRSRRDLRPDPMGSSPQQHGRWHHTHVLLAALSPALAFLVTQSEELQSLAAYRRRDRPSKLASVANQGAAPLLAVEPEFFSRLSRRVQPKERRTALSPATAVVVALASR